MPNSKNLNTYYDVAAVLVAAKEKGGAVYELPTEKAAKRWRFRAYAYRSLLAEAEKEKFAAVPGYIPTTPWDNMYLSLDENKVHIEFGTIRGVLKTEEGEVIDHLIAEPLTPAQPEVAAKSDDPLLSVALELVKSENPDES